jgi:hypothetical protein
LTTQAAEDNEYTREIAKVISVSGGTFIVSNLSFPLPMLTILQSKKQTFKGFLGKTG